MPELVSAFRASNSAKFAFERVAAIIAKSGTGNNTPFSQTYGNAEWHAAQRLL